MKIAKHGKFYLRTRRAIRFFEDWLGKERVEKIIDSLPEREISENISQEELAVNEFIGMSDEEVRENFDRIVKGIY